jgi:probable F420-dependent oxidoreductase
MRVETLLLVPSVAGGASGPAGFMDIDGIARSARRIEEMGFDGATAPEAGHDPFMPLAIAAEHTQRITLGTNVAIAFPRSPYTVAQIAWDLQRWSNGRFKLGLGTQVKGHNERRYSTAWPGPPGPRLREYVLVLKSIFKTFQSGEKPAFQGEHYTFTLISPFFNPGPIENPDVPIYISALNTYMARLGGELCDGILLHPLGTHGYTRDIVVPAIKKGAAKAGRPAGEVDIVASPFIITGKDRATVEAAMAPVRQQISFYSSTRTYHSVLEYHGWTEIGQQLHALSVEGKWQEMFGLITDDMLDEFAIIGTYDEIAPKIKERWGSVATTMFVAVGPQIWQDEKELGDLVEALRKA